MDMNIYETNVWDKLKECKHPVVLYGMGNGADKILEVFAQKGITCTDIFASDDFVRGQSFHGMRVKTFAEIERLYPAFTVVVAFATRRPEVLQTLFEMSRKYPVLAPDVPVAGITRFSREFYLMHQQQFEQVYTLLADEASKACFERIINFKIGGDIRLLKPFFEKERVYREVLCLHGETVVDLGAYDGDTLREFAAADPTYHKMIALEPDGKNRKKLLKKCADLRDVEVYPYGAWDKDETVCFGEEGSRNSAIGVTGVRVQTVRVDTLIKEPITLLKMDIEGSELKALEGAKNTIRRNRPKLYVCAYHRSEDLFALPLKIHQICPEYRFYFCHHPYVPAWESNFYAVIADTN